MEESNEAFEASSDSPIGITTPSISLADLTRGYKLLEDRATTPEKGLPFTERPVDALSTIFEHEKAALVLDELWARLCVVVAVEPNEDQELIERALIISEPADGDARTPRTRYWIRSGDAHTTELTSEPVANTLVCLVPNIVSSGNDGDDLFRTALLPALTLLAGIARAHENCVCDPIDVLRETLRCHGIEEYLDMAFVNWLVQCDYIYVTVPGPKAIWVRDDTYALLGLHEKIMKPADADEGRPSLPRKEFSRDLMADDTPEDLPPEPEAALPSPIIEVAEQETLVLDELPFIPEMNVPAEIEIALTPPILHTKIELTEETLDILEIYLAAHPEREAGELLSALVIEHLAPELRRLNAELDRDYTSLLEHCSKTYAHAGKPTVFTPTSVLRCYPPHLSPEETDAQLACMAERDWIRWVHPYRHRGARRRPPPYIVLIR